MCFKDVENEIKLENILYDYHYKNYFLLNRSKNLPLCRRIFFSHLLYQFNFYFVKKIIDDYNKNLLTKEFENKDLRKKYEEGILSFLDNFLKNSIFNETIKKFLKYYIIEYLKDYTIFVFNNTKFSQIDKIIEEMLEFLNITLMQLEGIYFPICKLINFDCPFQKHYICQKFLKESKFYKIIHYYFNLETLKSSSLTNILKAFELINNKKDIVIILDFYSICLNVEKLDFNEEFGKFLKELLKMNFKKVYFKSIGCVNFKEYGEQVEDIIYSQKDFKIILKENIYELHS